MVAIDVVPPDSNYTKKQQISVIFANIPSLENSFIWVKSGYLPILDDIRAKAAADLTWMVQGRGVEIIDAPDHRYHLPNQETECLFQSASDCSVQATVVDSTPEDHGVSMGPCMILGYGHAGRKFPIVRRMLVPVPIYWECFAMKMSHAQKKQFFEEGYIVIPGAVPQVTVRAARKAINAALGQGMDAEQMTKFRAQSYCPELQRSEAITDLVMKTPVWDYAESMVGEGCLAPVSAGQIALRFPTLQDPPPVSRPHLDGMYTPTNGVEKGKITNFTLLAVVLLSDVTETFAGNFTVWPRTHNPYQEYFRQHGPAAILEGMPPIDLPEPVQICGKAGDVCLTHYQIAHTAMCNASDNIRYAAIFRINHKDHSSQMAEVLTDIWKEWDGMRDFAPR